MIRSVVVLSWAAVLAIFPVGLRIDTTVPESCDNAEQGPRWETV